MTPDWLIHNVQVLRPGYGNVGRSSRNVAERTTLNCLGDIAVGHAADLVLGDEDEFGVPQTAQTWVDDRCVDQKSNASPPGTNVEPLNEVLIPN